MTRLLADEIEALQILDGQRERCRDLLEGAARSIVNWAKAEADYRGDDDEDWAPAEDDVERAMLLRSLNLLNRNKLTDLSKTDRSKIDEMVKSRRSHLLSTSTLDELYKKRGSHEKEAPPPDSDKEAGPTDNHKEARPPDNDKIPVFRACHIIQALVEDDDKSAGPFCQATLNCLYRLMTDIYRVEGSEWRLGGVRASRDAPQSAFITREAVRSILRIRQSLNNTVQLIEELWRADLEWHASKHAPDSWRTHMTDLRRENFKTSLKARWPHLLDPAVGIDEVDSWTETLSRLALDQLRNQWQTLRASLDTIRPSDARHHSVPVATHDRVTGILEGIHAAVWETLEAQGVPATPQLDDTTTRLKRLEEVTKRLKGAAATILRIVDPSEVYLEPVLLREVSADPSRAASFPDATRAAFAAAAIAEIRQARGSFDPDDHYLNSATMLAVNNLSERGLLQSGDPFDVSGKGYRLLPQSGETIRAMCDILSFSSVDCEPETARRLVRYFLDTRAGHPSTQPGWRSDIAPKGGKTEVWATALAFYALIDLRTMLDEQINRRVLAHFTVRQPADLKLGLDQLFLPDVMLALRNPKNPQKSIGTQLQRMRAHVEVKSSENDHSLVLYGPPGTGKSTLLEALAKSSDSPFVEVTPSDILIGGKAEIERHTGLAFSALSMLSQCVILFDEFDTILYTRERAQGYEGPPTTEFEFLTPGLLPKLKRLHDRAAKQRSAYALATNFVGHLDRAAIRSGRFDRRLGVFPPDLLSRVGRLATEMQKYLDEERKPEEAGQALEPEQAKAAIAVLTKSAGYGMATLGKPGWFTKPRRRPAQAGTLFGYIFHDQEIPTFGEKERNKEGVKVPVEADDPLGYREWREWKAVEQLDKNVPEEASAMSWDDYKQQVAALAASVAEELLAEES